MTDIYATPSVTHPPDTAAQLHRLARWVDRVPAHHRAQVQSAVDGARCDDCTTDGRRPRPWPGPPPHKHDLRAPQEA